ncbi:tyrosine-type recombinase/integrase [Streptosporangium sp. DT93]|uniref:tyrosine-type recombinase/integrase n=1 Tax=Streptosporangium sp. DT93 TaxID=3393428 RepID=UPI003CF590C2
MENETQRCLPLKQPTSSVATIHGLQPRRTRGGGGEVSCADVDLIDTLTGNSRHITTCWLHSAPTTITRQNRLSALARFLRWLNHTTPGINLLTVDENHLTTYRDALETGTVSTGVRNPGQPLKPATVAWRLAMLSSLFRHARRHHAINANPAEDLQRPLPPTATTTSITSALTIEEHHAVVAGTQVLATTRPMDAAAVALLTDCLLRAGELALLTANDITTIDGHSLIAVSRATGRRTVPVPDRTLTLLKPLRATRAPGQALLTKHNGRPIDRWWLIAALRRAALAGGIPKHRAQQLHPNITRPTAIALLEHETISPQETRQVIAYAPPETIVRYTRRVNSLDKPPLLPTGGIADDATGRLRWRPWGE